jgi:hypothetical protein
MKRLLRCAPVVNRVFLARVFKGHADGGHEDGPGDGDSLDSGQGGREEELREGTVSCPLAGAWEG